MVVELKKQINWAKVGWKPLIRTPVFQTIVGEYDTMGDDRQQIWVS